MSETSSRRGEKIGWTVGWIGGFFWVAILSLVFLYQGKYLEGILGLLQVVIWTLSVYYFAPWRHPDKIYFVLLLPLYGIFFTVIIWSIWAFGGLSALNEFNRLDFLWIFPALLPLPFLYKRKWNDNKSKQHSTSKEQ